MLPKQWFETGFGATLSRISGNQTEWNQSLPIEREAWIEEPGLSFSRVLRRENKNPYKGKQRSIEEEEKNDRLWKEFVNRVSFTFTACVRETEMNGDDFWVRRAL